jgi:hypothetical protein
VHACPQSQQNSSLPRSLSFLQVISTSVSAICLSTHRHPATTRVAATHHQGRRHHWAAITLGLNPLPTASTSYFANNYCMVNTWVTLKLPCTACPSGASYFAALSHTTPNNQSGISSLPREPSYSCSDRYRFANPPINEAAHRAGVVSDIQRRMPVYALHMLCSSLHKWVAATQRLPSSAHRAVVMQYSSFRRRLVLVCQICLVNLIKCSIRKSK